MNWGKAITLVFIGFATMILSLVYISFKQDISLVSKDYYKEEIAYQERINKLENAKRDKQKLVIKIESRIAYLSLNNHEIANDVEGKIYFFRPASEKHDRIFDLNMDQEGNQKIDLTTLTPGLWKVKFDWTKGGQAYYQEESIVF